MEFKTWSLEGDFINFFSFTRNLAFSNFRLILKALSVTAGKIWIGLNDTNEEGTWVWVNGERSVNAAVCWSEGQPSNSGGAENCAEILTASGGGFGTNDIACSNSLVGLCEKQYQP